jgi:DNA-binding CsgD family transcriptional regulator
MNLVYSDQKVTYTADFLETCLEFSRYLAMREHTFSEVISHVTYRIFSDLHPSGSLFTIFDGEKYLDIKAYVGAIPVQKVEIVKRLSVLDANAISRCFKTNMPIWSNADSELDFVSSEVTEPVSPSWTTKPVTSVSVPLEIHGSTGAVFTLFLREESKRIQEVELFISAISQIFYLYVSKSFPSKISQGDNNLGAGKKIESLTQRQLLVLELMADGKTNATISNTLGYSESTVRQETIKIFFKLGCKDRKEAANYFNSRRQTS